MKDRNTYRDGGQIEWKNCSSFLTIPLRDCSHFSFQFHQLMPRVLACFARRHLIQRRFIYCDLSWDVQWLKRHNNILAFLHRTSLPWPSVYGRQLMFGRSWVWIPAPYTGWKWHYSHWFVVKIVIVCLTRPKINRKEARVCPFKKTCAIRKESRCQHIWSTSLEAKSGLYYLLNLSTWLD